MDAFPAGNIVEKRLAIRAGLLSGLHMQAFAVTVEQPCANMLHFLTLFITDVTECRLSGSANATNRGGLKPFPYRIASAQEYLVLLSS
jgi:hypothetical protein